LNALSDAAAPPGALFQRLLEALPQTQCQRCGYKDCSAYAQAMALGEADINRCPPGGAQGVARLAALTHRPLHPLDPACGTEEPRTTVTIDEHWCIGCTLCIKACPVDAIVGANKLMHTVLPDECTGCGLCIPVCPVDCILPVNASASATGWDAWSAAQALRSQQRYAQHQERLARQTLEEGTPPPSGDAPAGECISDNAPAADATPPTHPRQAAIAQALERARALRQNPQR
jgi:electron transport complex protein RnfB